MSNQNNRSLPPTPSTNSGCESLFELVEGNQWGQRAEWSLTKVYGKFN